MSAWIRRVIAVAMSAVVLFGGTGIVQAAPAINDPGSLGQALLYHLSFATDIDGTPVDEGDVFREGAPRVLTLVGWQYVPSGTELRLRVFQGTRLVYDDARIATRELDGGYIFNYQPAGGVQAGTYVAQLDYNGVPDEVATFAVLPAGAAPSSIVPTGTTTGPTTPITGRPILSGPVPYADPAKVLVVTRASVLRPKLGARADAVFAAAAKVGTLRDLEADGVARGTEVAAVNEVRRLLRAGSYEYLLILGNDDAVPYARMPNPFADDERAILDSWKLPADWVPSDNPYTDLDGDEWAVPDLPTARIPSSDDADLLLKQLGQNVPSNGSAFALINQKRRGLVEPVLGRIDDTVSIDRHYAPQTTPQELPATNARTARFTYVLLHGIGVEADAWTTDIVAWSPESLTNLNGPWIVSDGNQRDAITIAQAGVPGGIVVVGACYGAWTMDTVLEPKKKTAANSLALAYLKSGTRAFIADTHLSYSAPQGLDGTPIARTGFEVLLWTAMLSGASPIDAFQAAKVGIAAEIDKAIAIGDYEVAALNFKTLEIMVYLGRP